jgi:dihydrodipicolinate synthase/N-acetylneuraminate lyase
VHQEPSQLWSTCKSTLPSISPPSRRFGRDSRERANSSAPKAHVALHKAFNEGDYKRAKQLQDVLADGDLAMQKLGVAGLKLIVKSYYGYGNGLARSPLPNANEEAFKGQKGVLDKLMDLEFSL